MLASITFPFPAVPIAALLFLRLTPQVYAGTPCCYPDGVTQAPLHIPCNASTLGTPQSAAACCRNFPTSYCVSNGLCYYNGVLSRASCTDRTWTSPSCAKDCSTENRNASISIFNCQEPGTFQCGWGDCSTSFTDQTSSTIILRERQKSAATSLPPKESNALAIGLGVGLSLSICLLTSLLLLFRQHHRLKIAESATGRRSSERTTREWHWPLGSGPSPADRGHTPSPPQPVYRLVRREDVPRALNVRRGPPPPLKIPVHRGPQDLRAGDHELPELDSYNYDANGTRQVT